MKTIVWGIVGCVALLTISTRHVAATWPPETVLEQEQNAVSTSTKLNSIQNQKEIMDKLAADERELESLMDKLKKDEKELSDLKKKYEEKIIQNDSTKGTSPLKK